MTAPVRHQLSAVGVIRVLIAESDARSRSLWRWSLDDDGRFVVIAEVGSGDELSAFEGEPDLLLVDITLPGLNAHDAIERFRPAHPACVIVVLAPVEVPYLRRAMAEAGADDYIVSTTPRPQVLNHLASLPRRD